MCNQMCYQMPKGAGSSTPAGRGAPEKPAEIRRKKQYSINVVKKGEKNIVPCNSVNHSARPIRNPHSHVMRVTAHTHDAADGRSTRLGEPSPEVRVGWWSAGAEVLVG